MALLSVLTGVLAISSLAGSPLNIGEVFALEVAQAPVGRLLGDVAYNGGNMSLYLVVMRGWLALGEPSELWLRLPSAFFAVASVPAFYCVAQRVAGRRAALMGTVLLATAPPLLQYAQVGRSYTMLVLLVVVSWLALLRHLDGASRWWYVAAATLSIYAHVLAAFVVAAQMVWLVGRAARVWRLAALIGILAVPQFILISQPTATPPDWVPPLSGQQVTGAMRFVTGAASDGRALLVLTIWVLGGLAAHRAARSGKTEASVPLMWAVVPVAATVAVSLVKPLLVTRYLLPMVPAGALLAGMALATLRRGIGWVGTVGLVLFAWPAASWALERQDPDWGAAADLVLSRAAPEEGIVFVNNARHLIEYHWERAGHGHGPTPLTEPLEWGQSRRRYPPLDLAEAEDRSAQFDEVWVVERFSLAFDPAGNALHDHVASDRRLVGHWTIDERIDIRLYGR